MSMPNPAGYGHTYIHELLGKLASGFTSSLSFPLLSFHAAMAISKEIVWIYQLWNLTLGKPCGMHWPYQQISFSVADLEALGLMDVRYAQATANTWPSWQRSCWWTILFLNTTITDDIENGGGATALLPIMAMKTPILIMTAFGSENEDNDLFGSENEDNDLGMRHTAI